VTVNDSNGRSSAQNLVSRFPQRRLWATTHQVPACHATFDSVRPEIDQVVQLIQGKDAKSLEDALALLQNTVFSFSMKVCEPRQDAEDTMQEVLPRL
jgi:hypothetical protein